MRWLRSLWRRVLLVRDAQRVPAGIEPKFWRDSILRWRKR